MHDLLITLDTIRERIKEYRKDLAKNEAMTRYVLIDPLLRSLDWDVSNPADVVPEEGSGVGGKTDYTMGRNSMVVEAKKFGEVLDKHTDKLVDYIRREMSGMACLQTGVSGGCTTPKRPQGHRLWSLM